MSAPRSPLRAVPEVAPRVLLAIRVSKERDGMVSPEIQVTAGTEYCVARGYVITGQVEGIDESGSRARSAWWPTLERAVAAVEAGQYDVIVVWKFSRIARHRLKWAEAIQRVEAVGGRIESATEQFDTTTSSGRLARGMIGELNAFMAEQIGEGWKEAHARRVANGRPPNGKPKWGYIYDPVQKLHFPDPVTGPVLVDLYRRYVAGESVYSLGRWLNAHGHRTLADGLWSDRTLRRVLDTGFAAGGFYFQGTWHDGVHEALITAKAWQAYQDARAARRVAPARRERSQYLLSGLVRCARCGRPMVAGQFGNARQPKYRCRVAKEMGPEACPGGYVMARFVEATVMRWLEELAEPADREHQAALLAKARRTTARADAVRLGRAVAKASEALGRLVVQQAETPSPTVVFRAAHQELSAQLEELEAAHEDALREQRRAVPDPKRVAKSMLQRWDRTPVAHRRTELGTLLERVEVLTGRPHAEFKVWTTWGECWVPPAG